MAEVSINKQSHQACVDNDSADQKTVDPEELRKRRLAYFQAKSTGENGSENSQDLITSNLYSQPSCNNTAIPFDVCNTGSDFANNLDNEFSKQDYRINSPLKEVKLKPSKSQYKPKLHIKHSDRVGEQLGEETMMTLEGHDNRDCIPRMSVAESQNLDMVSAFKSEADYEDLGLSTHRPSSPPATVSVLTKLQNGDNSLLEACELKSLLGDEKYEEFLQKSVKDINALYKHQTTETSPRMVENGDMHPSAPTSEQKSYHTEGNNVNLVYNKINSTVGPSARHEQPGRGNQHCGVLQQTYKNIHDMEQERQTGNSTNLRNYDQVLVSRNVTFSADEIYRQAYASRCAPVMVDQRYTHQQTPLSPQMASSPPYNFTLISPRQQINMGMNGPSYSPGQRSTAVGMYNNHGDYFVSPNSPASPQTSYFQPFFSGTYQTSPPQRHMMHPGLLGSSPQGTTYYNNNNNYHQQQHHTGYNVNNSNHYQYIPHPPPPNHPPPQYSHHQNVAPNWTHAGQVRGQHQHDQQQHHSNQFYTKYSNSQSHKNAKETNIQKETSKTKVKEDTTKRVSPKHQLTTKTELEEHDVGFSTDPGKDDTAKRHKDAVRKYHEQRRNLPMNHTEEEASNDIKPNTYAASSLNRYFSSLENIDGVSQADDTDTDGEESGHLDDNLTLVTEASGVSTIKAGGITDRIEKLGITIPKLKPENQSGHGDRKYKLCPECSTANKDYMTWCTECGEVLIGVESASCKKKKVKTKSGKTKVISKKETKTTPEPVIRQKETQKIEQSTLKIDTRPKPTVEQMKEAKQIIAKNSPKEEKTQFNPQVRRSEKDINDICEVITDPVIRGYIRSYFNKKNKSLLDDESKSEETSEEMPEVINTIPENVDTQDRHSLPTDEKTNIKNSPLSIDLNNRKSPCLPQENANSRQNPGVRNSEEEEINVDVEVFAVEESRESKNCTVPIVPVLHLATSSDEEGETCSQKQKNLSVESSIDTDVLQAALEKKMSSNGISKIKTQEKSTSFLAHILGPKGTTPKSVTKPVGKTSKDVSASSKPKKKANVPSKVAESMNTLPYQRRWEKSNLAWSAIHPREVNLKSSVSLPKARIGFPNKSRGTYSLENFASVDTTSIKNQTLGINGVVKGQRPASAELYKRKVQQQRPSSAQVRPNTSQGFVNTGYSRPSSSKSRPSSAQVRATSFERIPTSVVAPPLLVDDEEEEENAVDDVEDDAHLNVDEQTVNMPSIVDHRLPAEVARVVSQPVQLVPETSLSAYNKYIEMTPRIQDGDFSPWSCMPDEIWLNIFSYLNHVDLKNCGCVCQQFHRVALDEILWKYIAVKKRHDICDDWLAQIGKRHPISLALIQCHGDHVTNEGLEAMFKECADTLRELNFTRCSRGNLTGDNILLKAAILCHNLTHIDASWCHVTDNALLAIAESSNRLESVCLNGCQVISDVGLEALIGKHGVSLRVLEMFGCFNISQKGLRFLACHCTNLYTLNLGQCYKLTDSVMTQISANLGRIENLDLRGCKQIRNNCVRKIVRNCPRLKTLVLANCPNISDDAMVEVATYSMDIRNLDVCGCRNITDVSIRNITNNCLRLTSLDISSTGCTTFSVNMLANYGNRCLETVKLNFLNDVTESSLVKLVRHCSKLKILHLYGCSGVRNIDKLYDINTKLEVEM